MPKISPMVLPQTPRLVPPKRLVPYIGTAGEVKTKPTQHSVKELRSIGIQPDILLCRTDRLLSVLPPFHSFGLTAGMLMPLLNGIPTVHSPNPHDAAMLASLAGGPPLLVPHALSSAGLKEVHQATGFSLAIATVAATSTSAGGSGLAVFAARW